MSQKKHVISPQLINHNHHHHSNFETSGGGSARRHPSLVFEGVQQPHHMSMGQVAIVSPQSLEGVSRC